MGCNASTHRCQKMSMYQMYMPYDAAYEITSLMGEASLVEFKNLNTSTSSHNRAFTKNVNMCVDIENKLEFIRNEIKKDNIKMEKKFWNNDEPPAPNPTELIDFQTGIRGDGETSLSMFWKVDRELRSMIENTKSTRETHMKLMEFKEVMRSVEYYLGDPESLPDSGKSRLSFLFSKTDSSSSTTSLELICGTIKREKVHAFEKTVWRISMGNIFIYHDSLPIKLEDSETGHMVFKSVFIIVFQGAYLKSKIIKIMKSYHAKTYVCPATASERWDVYEKVCDRIEDLNDVIYEANLQQRNLLEEAAKYVDHWKMMVMKAKATYHTLNSFDFSDKTNRTIVAEFWIPDCHMDKLHALIKSKEFAFAKSGLYRVEVDEMPPTYFELNKFTQIFQDMVDSYGANTYEEVNPAPYLIITFPFLFSIMFGDWGHGLLMTTASAWLIINEKKLKPHVQENEVYRLFYNGRYITLMMGLFSIFSGLLYNECFGKSINLFGSGWNFRHVMSKLKGDSPVFSLEPETSFSLPYIFGMDPIWHLSKNAIVFKNSLRMKLSIILGVNQMLFGLFLSVENYIYFRKYRKIFTVFLPQLIFITFLFFYLIVLIFIKWYNYGPGKGIEYSSPCAPPILNTFISMILFTHQDTIDNCPQYFYKDQSQVELFLVIGAAICVPWLFFMEPLIIIIRGEYKTKETEEERKINLRKIEENSITSTDSVRNKKHYFQMHEGNQTIIDVIIHQGIHAIEFILGSVSNTASYLRLWALALAHEQLSEVSWNQIMRRALTSDPGFAKVIFVFLAFALWAVLTVAVLVLMEGLSAYLHALRLHWIEFQSKFYEGNGHKFQPFSFKDLSNRQ